MSDVEFDTDFTDDIVCPYCGEHHDSTEVRESCKFDCDECNRVFRVEVDYSVSYSTSKIENDQ